jgi:polyisoprenoid-binding protein YceI
VIRHLLAIVALGLAAPVLAQETYTIDPVHSQPSWEARHIGYGLQRGSFQKFTGKVALDRAQKTGTVDVVIDATSIRTFDARLDGIVKGERFFNVEKFPTITFKSTKVGFDGDRVVQVDGELTMLGVTQPVSLKMDDFHCGEQAFNKKPMCGGNAVATIKRSDWGITQGVTTMTPGDEVVLRIPFEALKDAGA